VSGGVLSSASDDDGGGYTARCASSSQINQCVATPLALSQGCGLIALYTSPYLTPSG
jgi:hypothetical protein